MIILLFLLLTAEAAAQYCYPTDRIAGQTLQGCDNIHKREERVVVVPGFTEHVIQDSYGACAQRSSCDPIIMTLGLAGKEECWPQFNDPVISYGSWKRTVVDARIAIGHVGSCSQKTGEYVEQVPLLGPKCAPGVERTATFYHPCETAGGITVGMTSIHTLDPWDPCWMSFVSGIPCWMYPNPFFPTPMW
jgi:hypothetical protein